MKGGWHLIKLGEGDVKVDLHSRYIGIVGGGHSSCGCSGCGCLLFGLSLLVHLLYLSCMVVGVHMGVVVGMLVVSAVALRTSKVVDVLMEGPEVSRCASLGGTTTSR